jgi:hypothetical protein
MLMSESARGEASPFAPYFATLPEATDCLLNWSEEERQLLAGGSAGVLGVCLEDCQWIGFQQVGVLVAREITRDFASYLRPPTAC